MNPIIAPQAETRNTARRLIRREMAVRFAEERKGARLWRRLVLWLKIEREVAREMKRRFPPHALFASQSAALKSFPR